MDESTRISMQEAVTEDVECFMDEIRAMIVDHIVERTGDDKRFARMFDDVTYIAAHQAAVDKNKFDDDEADYYNNTMSSIKNSIKENIFHALSTWKLR